MAKIWQNGVGKITDIKKGKYDIKNYLNHVDSSDTGNDRKNLYANIIMKWFHRDRDDNNGDFIQMERANESGNEDVRSTKRT